LAAALPTVPNLVSLPVVNFSTETPETSTDGAVATT